MDLRNDWPGYDPQAEKDIREGRVKMLGLEIRINRIEQAILALAALSTCDVTSRGQRTARADLRQLMIDMAKDHGLDWSGDA